MKKIIARLAFAHASLGTRTQLFSAFAAMSCAVPAMSIPSAHDEHEEVEGEPDRHHDRHRDTGQGECAAGAARDDGVDAALLLPAVQVLVCRFQKHGSPFYSTVAERSWLTSRAVTGAPRLPHAVRMNVTTDAISLSFRSCANGGIPYGIGLRFVPGG